MTLSILILDSLKYFSTMDNFILRNKRRAPVDEGETLQETSSRPPVFQQQINGVADELVATTETQHTRENVEDDLPVDIIVNDSDDIPTQEVCDDSEIGESNLANVAFVADKSGSTPKVVIVTPAA